MKRLSCILICFVFVCLNLYAEPSAFEMQSGVTKKDMRDLRDIADFTRSVISDFQSKIANLEQSVDGLKSVYESVSFTSRQDSLALKDSLNKMENLNKQVRSLNSLQKTQQKSIDDLKSQISLNSSNIEQLNKKIDKLSEAFLQANQEIVKQIKVLNQQALALQDAIVNIQNVPDIPKDSSMPSGSIADSPVHNSNKNEIDSNNVVDPIIDTKVSNSPSAKQFSSDNVKNLNDAKMLFRQNKLDEARLYFEYLVDIKYAVAESSYYLGEIYYAKKEYNDALPYYKTSASMDSKASYMPILLWHTAWSFKYLNDQVNYEKFLQTLATLFPSSEQGLRAKNILKK